MFSSFDPHFQDFHFSGNDISAFSLLSKYTSLSLPASFSNLTLIFLYAVENSLPPCSSSTDFWSASSWMATFSTPLFPRSENLWVGLSKILKRNYHWKINILNCYYWDTGYSTPQCNMDTSNALRICRGLVIYFFVIHNESVMIWPTFCFPLSKVYTISCVESKTNASAIAMTPVSTNF